MSETKRFKLVHIIHFDGPGGGPITMSLHVNYYHKHFDITVIAGGRGVAAETCAKLNVPFIQLPIEKLWKCLWGAPMLWWKLRQLRPNVVILHGQWAGPLGAVTARLAGISRILYICQWPSFYTDWDLGRCLRNFVAEKIPCMLVDKVIALSESGFYQYQYRRLASPPKLVLSTNPIDLTQVPTEAERARIRERHGWTKDHVHVVSVGRLVDQKRVDWLLRAWAGVIRRAPQARLWILGDGPEEAMLKELTRSLDLTSSVTFLGAQREGWAYQAAADVVAMSTIYEAHSRVPLEALSSGTALVANDVDGVRDTFRADIDGILVPPADVPALEEALVKVILSPELRDKLRLNALEYVKIYDQPVVLKRYFDIIYDYAIEAGNPLERLRKISTDLGVLRWLSNYLESIAGWKITFLNLILIALIAWSDYALGYKVGLLFFYAVPIAIMSLRFGSWNGILFSIVTTMAWYLADIGAVPDTWDYRISLWNGLMRVSFWIFFSACLGSLNATIRQREMLISELQTALTKSRST